MFKNLFGNPNSNGIPQEWLELQTLDDAKNAIERSKQKPVLIFKHSIRCSISSMAQARLGANSDEVSKFADIFYLDLIAYRDVSDWISENLNVIHQSPQIILVKNKAVTYVSTHNEISGAKILDAIQSS